MNSSRRARVRVRKHHDQLVAARDDALEQSRQKAELVAVVSHEIRTPMNGVIGLAELLLDTSLSAQQRTLAEGILESAEALLHVVNETLDFSKLEAGKVALEAADFDLARTIESVVKVVAVSAQAKGLALRTDIAPSVPVLLHGDAGRLRQLLFNLVGNAVKFTEVGSVTIRVSATPSESTDNSVTLHIAVADTGIGIAGDPERLFEPFSQASSTTARRFGGTGLGLAICARLAGAMGGTVRATSELGQGSTFQLDVPFALGVAAPSHPAGEKGAVLIVDDNGINRLVAAQMVSRLGYVCDTANNGVEALEMLGRRRYVAVLMDCFMPEMDGFEATEELRAREGDSRHTSVIATTAGALDGDRARCEAVGMDDYVAKPMTLDSLGAALRRSAHA